MKKTKSLLDILSASILGVDFSFTLAVDKKYGKRLYIQCTYTAPCTKTGELEEWAGRKFYLSDHMTQDEVVKTAYVAFKSAVEHEVMEGFKVDGKILFNPHTSFEDLLTVSHKEVTRDEE